jgi:hypothetical protein
VVDAGLSGSDHCLFVYGEWSCAGEKCKDLAHRPNLFVSE